MRDAALDLLTGGHCAACGAAGRALCSGCRAALDVPARLVSPDPRPPGLVPTWATGAYDDALRRVVVAHKERGVWSLARPLGELLAGAVGAATSRLAVAAPEAVEVLLVPVPSSRSSVRQRAYDPTRAMVQACATRLRREGARVRVAPLLCVRAGVRDQAGLSATDRRANLDRALWCPSGGLARLARGARPRWVVVCDDVLTTGSTLVEAQRALSEVGLAPVAAACVAATQRRGGGAGGTPGGDQGPFGTGTWPPSQSPSTVPLPGVAGRG